MRNIAPCIIAFNCTPLGAWAEQRRSQPWPIRRIAARYHLPMHMAATIAEITGIGGARMTKTMPAIPDSHASSRRITNFSRSGKPDWKPDYILGDS